jgi:hypothetical protein
MIELRLSRLISKNSRRLNCHETCGEDRCGLLEGVCVEYVRGVRKQFGREVCGCGRNDGETVCEREYAVLEGRMLVNTT